MVMLLSAYKYVLTLFPPSLASLHLPHHTLHAAAHLSVTFFLHVFFVVSVCDETQPNASPHTSHETASLKLSFLTTLSYVKTELVLRKFW